MYFQHVPPQIREQKLQAVRGMRAIKFPVAYFMKAPYAASPLWEIVSGTDQDGYSIRICYNPVFLDGFIKKLTKYGVDFEVIIL